MSLVLAHVVLAKFRAETPQSIREVMRERMASLGEACGGPAAGILHWRADWNLDQRKGYHLMEFAIFADGDALQRFREHPDHLAFATAMSEVADWIVGDLMTQERC